MKILVVEDSPIIRNMHKIILTKLGYTNIVEAADGVEALNSIQEADPGLMLLDWGLPNMDGLTLLKKVRELGKKFPIIMCTADSEKSHVILAIQAGANNYVVKPFSAKTMIEKIDETIKNVQAARAGGEAVTLMGPPR